MHLQTLLLRTTTLHNLFCLFFCSTAGVGLFFSIPKLIITSHFCTAMTIQFTNEYNDFWVRRVRQLNKNTGRDTQKVTTLGGRCFLCFMFCFISFFLFCLVEQQKKCTLAVNRIFHKTFNVHKTCIALESIKKRPRSHTHGSSDNNTNNNCIHICSQSTSICVGIYSRKNAARNPICVYTFALSLFPALLFLCNFLIRSLCLRVLFVC